MLENEDAMNTPIEVKPLLIGGEWRRGEGTELESVNPATGKVNYHVSGACAADVDDAIAAATEAACGSEWKAMLPHKRAEILHRIADIVTERAVVFAEAQMHENGKVLSECRAQVASSAATFRYFAAVCETLGSEVTPSRGGYISMTVYEPHGVVVAITPWNSPMTMEAQKVAPALAAGNAIVLKPSEVTPSPALELGRAALDAGLPAGVLNVLPGTGAETGACLVEHPGVRMISFTGGTASGRAIAGVAAKRLVPAALELGGKSPHVIFADANIEAAVDAVAGGIFEGSGQSCVAGSRLFVERVIFDRVVSMLVDRARSLNVDLPEAPGAQMGPIASFRHRETIERMIAGAKADGVEILAGGERPDARTLADGAFYLPTVLVPRDNSVSICQEEIFGPVICALPFDDEDDLVAQANDTVFGLAAGIWTADYQRAWRVARSLEAGTVWINTYKQLSISTPFGGFKDSGLGREKGVGGMRLYQQTKSIYWGMDKSLN